MLGHQIFILVTYLTLRRTKKNYALDVSLFGGSGGVPLGCRCVMAPLDPAEVGQEQSGIVGGNTGPSVAYASSSIAYWMV